MLFFEQLDLNVVDCLTVGIHKPWLEVRNKMKTILVNDGILLGRRQVDERDEDSFVGVGLLFNLHFLIK